MHPSIPAPVKVLLCFLGSGELGSALEAWQGWALHRQEARTCLPHWMQSWGQCSGHSCVMAGMCLQCLRCQWVVVPCGWPCLEVVVLYWEAETSSLHLCPATILGCRAVGSPAWALLGVSKKPCLLSVCELLPLWCLPAHTGLSFRWSGAGCCH